MKQFKYFLLIVLAVTLPACSTLREKVDEDNLYLKIAVVEGTSYVIKRDDDPVDKAARVKAYAEEALAKVEGGEIAGFDDLKDYLIAELPSDMVPTARLATVEIITALVEATREKFTESVGEENIDDFRVNSVYFLNLVIETAEFYS